MASNSPDIRRVGRNLAIAAVGAIVAAVLVNVFLAPRVATWFFSKTPIRELNEFDEARTRATRKVATSFLAGLIGPPNPGGNPVASTSGDGMGPGGASDVGGRGDAASNSGRRQGAPEGRDEGDESKGGPTPSAESADQKGDDAERADVPDTTPVYELDRRRINQRLDNPEQLRSRISFVETPGDRPGLRVRELQGYYAKFGLQPGDVVLAINGRVVHTRQQAIQHLVRMRRQTIFRLEVRREGETFEIHYRVPRK